MSIRINYKGNIGNSLFQYVYARLLAERNGLYLTSVFPYQKVIQTTPHRPGAVYTNPKIVFDEPYISENGNYPERNDIRKRFDFYHELDKKLAPGQYVLNGYFEYADLFNTHEELIRSYFYLDCFEKNEKDIVMNIRFGDFAKLGRMIDSNWYLQILENEKFEKLYIVGAKADEPYLKAFEKYKPIIIPSHSVNDFHFIRKFNKIICSNSTFCWWAAFLSEANTIYISDKWISPLLTSCRNSTLIKANYLPSYTTSFDYLPAQLLINFNDNVKLKLDDHLSPAREEVRKFIKGYITTVYNAIRSNSDTRHFELQLDVNNIGRFSMRFYEGGSWLYEGSAMLADCSISFPDWKSLYDWVFYGLRDIGDSYLTVKGSTDAIVSWFDLSAHENELTLLYNDFKKEAPFIDYAVTANVVEDALTVLNNSAVVAFFESANNRSGKIYLAYKENDSPPMKDSSNECYFLNPVEFSKQPACEPTFGNMRVVWNAMANKGESLRVFNVLFKKANRQQMYARDALRLFSIMEADYLITGDFIIRRL
jgi:hypothetical protein